MRRIMFLLVAMTILFYGCVSNPKFKVGEQMSEINNNHTPYIRMNALYAYENSGNYFIVIGAEDVVQKSVEFSPKRQCSRVQGLNLIKSEDINKFLNMNIYRLKEELGQPHVDIGSGFYIPAYITDDAYLICLELEDDIVFEVIKRDLLTNVIIERVSN